MTNREPSEAMIEAGAKAAFEAFEGLQTTGKPWDGQSKMMQEAFRAEVAAAYLAMEATKDRETASPASEAYPLVDNATRALAAFRRGDWDMGDVGSIEMAIAALASPTPRDTLVEAAQAVSQATAELIGAVLRKDPREMLIKANDANTLLPALNAALKDTQQSEEGES